MGAVVCSVKDLLDTIIDIVGIKSGLVLSRRNVLDILKERAADFDLADDELDVVWRIRSEVYEDHIRFVRVKIGNLKPEMLNPFLWSDRLMPWIKQGIDPIPVVKALSEVGAKYPHQVLDPDIVIREMQAMVPDASRELILNVIQIWLDHKFQSEQVTRVEQEKWDGGTPLDNLFRCEIASDENFMDQKFLDYVAVNTEKLQVIHWRNFERFCAEFFNRLGYVIELGPGSNDGGIDIRAFNRSLLSMFINWYSKIPLILVILELPDDHRF